MKIAKKHTIIVDTREQKPLEFYKSNIKTRLRKLNCGDYRMRFSDGKMSNTVFERKTVADLFGSMTKGHERFKQEITRARSNNVLLIMIIEGSLSKVAKGIRHSKIQGISIVRTVFSLWVRYGVIPVFAKDRHEASEYIVQYYMAEWRKKLEAKK